MLIVSENKEVAVNMDCIDTICFSENESTERFVLHAFHGESCTNIADFEDRKSAELELNHIVTAYANGEKVYIMP